MILRTGQNSAKTNQGPLKFSCVTIANLKEKDVIKKSRTKRKNERKKKWLLRVTNGKESGKKFSKFSQKQEL